MECLHLRAKDIDFERNQIFVRDGKGMKDRVTTRQKHTEVQKKGNVHSKKQNRSGGK